MQYTQNLNLKKPDLTDNIKISDLNENADIIDNKIGILNDLNTTDKSSVVNAIKEVNSNLTSHETDTTTAHGIGNKIDKSLLTAIGDMIYASAANTPARLAKGTAYQGLGMNSGGTIPQWMATLQSLMTSVGDIIYASAANTPARIGIGTVGQALISDGTKPIWGSAGVQVITGNYTGDGSTSRSIAIGFQPKFLSISCSNSSYTYLYNGYCVGIMNSATTPLMSNPGFSITSTGFQTNNTVYPPNMNDYYYSWIAIG